MPSLLGAFLRACRALRWHPFSAFLTKQVRPRRRPLTGLEALEDRVVPSATVTVTAPDPDASVAGPGTGAFTIQRTGDTSQGLMLNYNVSGTATQGTDYAWLQGVYFAPGEDHKDILVTPLADNLRQGDETVVFTVQPDPAGNYDLGDPSTATVTIHDDPPPVVSVTAPSPDASEVGPTPGTFLLSRTGDLSASLTVTYWLGGSATFGSDYTGPASSFGSVTFAAGDATASVIVTPVPDSLPEGDETVVFSLMGSMPGMAGYYVLGDPSSATITIHDSAAPVVSVTATDPDASKVGPDTGTFLFQRGGDLSQGLTVFFDLGGTAIPDSDYTGLASPYGAASFAPGQATSSVVITPLSNNPGQGDKTVMLSLKPSTADSYAVGSPSSATVTIHDAPPVPPTVVTVSASDPEASADGPSTGVFTFSRTGDLSQSLMVSYSVGGTAVPGTDYDYLQGVAFAPGDSQEELLVTPRVDNREDGDETVVVTVQPGMGGTYAFGDPSSATVTIHEGPLGWPPPLLIDPGAQSSLAGDSVSLPIQAHDVESPTLTYAAANLPPGLAINPTSGLISGQIDPGAVGLYSGTVTVSDGVASASQALPWTVSQVELLGPPEQISREGDEVELPLFARSAQPDPIVFSAVGLPAGLAVDADTGIISGTIASDASLNGPYAVTVTAAAGAAAASQSFSWTVPQVFWSGPGDQINAVGDSVRLPVVAATAAGGPLTFSAAGLPSGLTIDPATGLISGTVASDVAGATTSTVTVSASDGLRSGSAAFSWIVTDDSLQLLNPGDQSNSEGDTVSVDLPVLQGATGPVAFQATGLPDGLVIDPDTGLISGTISADASVNNGGSYSVTVLAADSGGASGTVSFTWSVAPTPQAPTLTAPGPQVGNLGDPVLLQVEATDPHGLGLTFSATGLPAGLSLDSATGSVAGTLSGATVPGSPALVTVTASNGVLSTSATFAWTVTDGTVSVTNPGDQESAEGQVVSLPIVAGGSGGSVTYSAVGLPAGLSIAPDSGVISGRIDDQAAETAGGEYNVSVVASGPDGGSGSTSFVWVVTHTNRPPVLPNPGAQYNAEGDQVWLELSAQSPDGSLLHYLAAGLPAGLQIDPDTGAISGTVDYSAAEAQAGSYLVSILVYDDNGLEARQAFSWAIAEKDYHAPLDAEADQASTNKNDAVMIPVLANDSDPEGGAFAVTAVTQGYHGIVSFDGSTVTYTPEHNWAGVDSFAYTIGDGQGRSSSARVTVTVNEVNYGPPTASDEAATTPENSPVLIQLSGSDIDEDFLGFAVITGPAHGTLGAIADGQVMYFPDGDYVGPDSFTFKANDGSADSAPGTVSILVSPAAQAPGVTVTTPGGELGVTPGGEPSHFSVVLNTQPTAPVTLMLSSELPLNLSTRGLVFTPDNWDVPQDVEVGADDDPAFEGVDSGSIHIAASSGDPNYNSPFLAVQDVEVNVWPADFPPDRGPKLTNTVTATSPAVLTGARATARFEVDYRYLEAGKPVAITKVPGPLLLDISAEGLEGVTVNGVDYPVSPDQRRGGRKQIRIANPAATTVVSVSYRRTAAGDSTARLTAEMQGTSSVRPATASTTTAFRDVNFLDDKTGAPLATVVTGYARPVFASPPLDREVRLQAVAGIDLNKMTFAINNPRPAVESARIWGWEVANAGRATVTVRGELDTPAKPGPVPVPDGRMTLQVRDKALKVVSSVPVIVVVPKSISPKHPQPDSVVEGKNVYLGQTTSPRIDKVPPGKLRKMTIYGQVLPIQVLDQFGRPLDAIYAGTKVSEGGVSINQTMRADGTYLDPVGFFYEPVPSVDIAETDKKAIADWGMQAPLPPPPGRQQLDANATVQVAGHSLRGGITNRKVKITRETAHSARVQVIWP